jgi:tetrahydromethanopterin S-methyltransferase subunit C
VRCFPAVAPTLVAILGSVFGLVLGLVMGVLSREETQERAIPVLSKFTMSVAAPPQSEACVVSRPQGFGERQTHDGLGRGA